MDQRMVPRSGLLFLAVSLSFVGCTASRTAAPPGAVIRGGVDVAF
jgi:hypothetical protein